MKKYVFFLGLLLHLGCNEKSGQISEAETEDEKLSAPLNIEARHEVLLLPQAKNEIQQWMAYNNAETAIEKLKDYNLQELMANSQQLISFIQELQLTLPTNYKVPPIESRINVLHTKALVLQQELESESIELKEIKLVAREIVSSFEYLKIQLNELFLQSPTSFEIDLFEIEAKQDSLQKARQEAGRAEMEGTPVLSPLKKE